MANKYILDALKETTPGAWKCYLREQHDHWDNEEETFTIDLCNADLKDRDLRGYEFDNAVLVGTVFINAKLDGTSFRNATLSKSDLSGASLKNACLVNANLSEANLSYADLTGADIQGAKMPRTVLNDSKLCGADLSNAHLLRASLKSANMIGVQAKKAIFYEADMQNADMTGANLKGASLEGADLTGAILKETDLTDALLRDTKGIIFDETIISNLPLGYSDLWTNLCRKYTGSRLFVHLLLLIVFIVPRLSEIAAWATLSSLERIVFVEVISSRPFEVAKEKTNTIPYVEKHVRDDFEEYIDKKWQRSRLPCLVFLSLDNWKAFIQSIPGILLFFYVAVRTYLTLSVQFMFEEQKRTGRTPPWLSNPEKPRRKKWLHSVGTTLGLCGLTFVKGYSDLFALDKVMSFSKWVPWLALITFVIRLFLIKVWVPA